MTATPIVLPEKSKTGPAKMLVGMPLTSARRLTGVNRPSSVPSLSTTVVMPSRFRLISTSASLRLALKRTLLQAYHGEGRNVSDHDTLVAIVEASGLDAAEARQVLATGRFAAEVRERERFYQQRGIRAVPSVILNERHLVQGGQPPEVFEQALRQLAGISG